MREDKLCPEPSGSDHSFRESKIPVLSVSGVTRLLLALTSLYIVFASLAVCLADVQRVRFFNLYYLLVMGVCSYVATVSLREVSFRRTTFGKERLVRISVFLATGFVAWIVYRYPHLFAFSLWMDEITQFQGDWNLPRTMVDPAIFAAIQQQPPIDYYLSAFARTIFGTNEFAALFHTIVFGVLSLGVFLLWLIQIRFPLALAPVPVLLFAAHHTLLRFSSEARPISLSVFFTLTTMILLYESVQRRRVSAMILGVSSVLLLYAIGLQPMFFLSALAIGIIPLLFWQLKRAEAVKTLLALWIVPLCLFSPTLWEIYWESEKESQFFATSYMDLWWNALKAVNWSSFWTFQKTIQFAEWILVVPVIVLLLALLMKAVKIKKLPAETISWSVAGIIFAILFPLAFLVFWSIINWTLNLYYFVLWPVGLFVFASLAIALLFRPALEGTKKIWVNALLALVSLGTYYQLQHSYVPAHKTQIGYDHSFRPNWHTVIDLAHQSKNPVLVVEVPYGSFGWPPYHSVSGEFYEDPPDIRVIRLEIKTRNNFGIPPFRIQETLKDFDYKSDVFYLMSLVDDPGNVIGEERKQKILQVMRENSDELIQLSSRNYLLKVNDQERPIETTKILFKKLVEADPEGSRNFYLADALTAESVKAGACVEAKKWFGVMQLTEKQPKQKFAGPDESLKKYLTKVRGKIAQIPECGGVSTVNLEKSAPSSMPN